MLPHFPAKTILFTLVSFTLVSCDGIAGEDVQQKANDTPAAQADDSKSKSNPTPTPDTKAPDDSGNTDLTAKQAVQKYATCASTCYTSDKIKANQETCKLNCRNVLGVQLAKRPLKDAALNEIPDINAKLDGCITKCEPEDSANNQATCILNCTTAVAVKTQGVELDPSADAPALTTCDDTCTARLNVCKDSCKNDKALTPDNRATCNLNCENTVTACKRTCRAKKQ